MADNKDPSEVTAAPSITADEAQPTDENKTDGEVAGSPTDGSGVSDPLAPPSSDEPATGTSELGERKSQKSNVSSPASPERKESKPASKAASKAPSAKSSQADQTLVGKKSSEVSYTYETRKSQGYFQGPFAKIAPFDKFCFSPKDDKAEVPEKLKIENTVDKPIIFKIKTTTPEGYRVRPSLGIVQPNGTGEIEIFLQPDRIKQAHEDRFLVMVMTTDSDSMTQQQIADAFKNVNKAQNRVMEHRVSCQVGSEGPKDGQSGPLKTPRSSKSGAAGGSGGNNLAALKDLLSKVKDMVPGMPGIGGLSLGGLSGLDLSTILQGTIVASSVAAISVFSYGYYQAAFGEPMRGHFSRMKHCMPWN